jgi:hypothetical protein
VEFELAFALTATVIGDGGFRDEYEFAGVVLSEPGNQVPLVAGVQEFDMSVFNTDDVIDFEGS